MSGINDLNILLTSLTPELQDGQYVFCTVPSIDTVNTNDVVGIFKEKEAITVILNKDKADVLEFSYAPVFAWITLTVHSSLQATGLTAAFATALSNVSISCNVIAGFYHDHIFVDYNDAERAMSVLRNLSAEK